MLGGVNGKIPPVIPAQAGIPLYLIVSVLRQRDPRFRADDRDRSQATVQAWPMVRKLVHSCFACDLDGVPS
jgi:hypothetical protein